MAELNFQDAERIIRENPKQADALAFAYQQYFKNNQGASSAELPQSILDGKAISEAYDYLREQHEDAQMNESGAVDLSKVPQTLAATPILAAAFFIKPKIIEDDGNYQQIEEKLKSAWLKEHNAKDFFSKEGLDYLHGDINDRTKTSLRKEAMDLFRNNPKYKDRLARYDRDAGKIYKNHEDDPRWQRHKADTQAEISDRLEFLERNKSRKINLTKQDVNNFRDQIAEDVKNKSREEFSKDYSSKAVVYFERLDRETKKHEKKIETKIDITTTETQVPLSSSPGPVTSQVGQTHPVGDQRGSIGKEMSNLTNAPNNPLKNPFGKPIAPRGVALRGAAAVLLSPITIAIFLTLLFTLIVIITNGVPLSEPTTQTTSSTQ